LDSALLVRAGQPDQMVVLLRGGLVKLVDLASYQTVDADFLLVGEHALRIACSSDGNRMAIGYSSSSPVQVTVLDMNSGERMRELIGAQRWEDCERISLSGDGSRVVGISNNLLAVLGTRKSPKWRMTRKAHRVQPICGRTWLPRRPK
jgi:hypothetical protein